MPMTADEQWMLAQYTCDITLRSAMRETKKGHRVMPGDVWSGGEIKTQPVARARAICGLVMRCTVGRRVHVKGEKPEPRPWEIHPDGLPEDGSYEQASYPLLGRCLGGHHTTFIAAIGRFRRDYPDLVLQIEREVSCLPLQAEREDKRGDRLIVTHRIEMALWRILDSRPADG